MKNYLTDILAIGGSISITTGVACFSVPLAFIVFGAFLIVGAWLLAAARAEAKKRSN